MVMNDILLDISNAVYLQIIQPAAGGASVMTIVQGKLGA